jgi:hypothetical protein
MADLALFVRDAVGLAVPSSADRPPLVDGPVPDRRDVLSHQARADAAAQWPHWWQRIVEFEFKLGRSHDDEPSPRIRGAHDLARVIADAGTVSDPPDFNALADSPQLRAAVRATYADAAQWQRTRQPRPDADVEWSVTKRAAEDVAFDREVPVEKLDAAVIVLPVTGVWSRRTAPGYALCSVAAARSAQAGYQVLYDVFASCLDR